MRELLRHNCGITEDDPAGTSPLRCTGVSTEVGMAPEEGPPISLHLLEVPGGAGPDG